MGHLRSSLRSARHAFFICALGLLPLSVVACAPPLTQADVDRFGKRNYPNVSSTQAFQASITALRSLGFEPSLADEAAGRIKSAPRMLVAQGGYSRAAGVSAAWDIDVTNVNGLTTIYARPRVYEGGELAAYGDLDGEYIRKMYDALFSEIESTLGHAAVRRTAAGR